MAAPWRRHSDSPVGHSVDQLFAVPTLCEVLESIGKCWNPIDIQKMLLAEAGKIIFFIMPIIL
jgi:hypothetical protein